ncbi:hypothetical protein BN175_1350007 [Clostridioides difficile T23]|uniref:Uncharacterized protein n=1 Tax=Clostridioides difficile TaxID=1496 RepID=A0A069AQU4_CLODI|nr:hypothetical protein BN169_690017 [Clostridioides difficile E16]CCL13870.1 hypothetical protein BN170_1510007 [Clostridioides difficile T22]CCL21837.1 hypothetical protein BN172_2520007 [Clostridioides difficile T15]CCL29875.1 hypothetical protein BN174_1570009 [Clostridioides difficile E15]CCL33839.1 hypothetical protein BN175_1350007 [Clostridioides difficile T23]CCL37650.1 hypothetical protein BN176_1570007 [Clostridioides difficile E19]CCL57087.1 hypothetical protein BN181_2030007 [Clo
MDDDCFSTFNVTLQWRKREEYEVFILFILSNPCIYIVYLRNILNKWFLIVSDIFNTK